VGQTIWIDVRGRPGSETHNDMSVLLRLDRELDALAEKFGVAKLSDFHDTSQLIDEYKSILEEAGVDSSVPDPSWVDSSTGLETVTTLRLHLERDFSVLNWQPDKSRKHWPENLLNDLRFCEKVLNEAVSNAQPFRLMIVS
jgi:hypothetical protein